MPTLNGGVLLLCMTAVMSSCEPMELSSIRYRFTPCGQTGRTGPSYEMCLDAYQNTTVLSNRNNFFFFEQLDASAEQYQGGQGFRVPVSGRYNISLAGAAGGRGLCNTDHGRGLLWKGQADFKSGEELLILVGQRGRSPCDNEEFPGLSAELCHDPPQTEEDSAACNHTWYLNLENTVPNTTFSLVYENTGGGGGGGASMIRLFNQTSEGLVGEQFPIVVAPGGGGSAAVTEYSIINQTLETFPVNSTFREEYQQFLDGKHALYDPQDRAGYGTRGYVYEFTIFKGGAGGGYLTLRNSADVDGGYLNAEENFAEGGFDCTRQLFELYLESPNIYGGFGGGGGQCGCGGSGGGFSGGRSTGADHLLPGQGGYYYKAGSLSRDTQEKKGLMEIGTQLNEFEDGYVEFVLGNCGCAGLCTVNEQEDTFECHCIDNETTLAPNGFDCAKDIVADLSPNENETAVYTKQFTFTPLHIIESLSVLGIDNLVLVVSNDTDSQTASCSLVFLGAVAEPVLTTNIVSMNGTLDQLAIISTQGESTLSLSEYYQSLPTPVTVTGGFLVSEGNCQLLTRHVNFTVSTQNVSAIPVVSDVLESMSYEDLYSLAQLVLQRERTETTTEVLTATDPNSEVTGLVVWSLVGVSVACVGCLFCVLIFMGTGLTYYRWNNKRKRLKQMGDSQRHIFAASTNSMVPNAFYHAYRGTINETEPSVRNSYVPTRPPQIRIEPENHGYEIISFSEADGNVRVDSDPITSSARHFPTKFGVNAPVHDFTVYNRSRVGNRAHSWEYPRGKLVYLRELGEGQFGKVLLMKAKGIADYDGEIPVAVKTLSFRAPNMLEKFIQETNLMKKFCHPNIVSLLGVSSHDVNEDSAPLMILEYMPYGDLHGFLVKNRPQSSQPAMITPAHFFSIGRDVAEALSFLSSQGFVHRDVAARNCLVGPDLSIKIADFGLAREIMSKNYYRVEGKSVLPVKWMAPESLIYGVFTTASDVWSYGVLLWEVVTFGELPFEDLSTEDVIKMAESKELVHPRPPNCPEEIFVVVCSCHHNDPKQRIQFDEILRSLAKDKVSDDYFKQC